jgi:hypothetical protein
LNVIANLIANIVVVEHHLRHDEIDKLVAATPERWPAFIVLAIWTGMRFGEMPPFVCRE